MPHIHEKIDFVVDVFVVYDNKVLIRLHDKYKRWLAVGGHVELDETPDVAAVREVKEEVGLDIRLIPPYVTPQFDVEYTALSNPWYMNIHPVNEVHKHLSLVYFASSESDVVVPEKADDKWQWVSKEELESNELGIGETTLFYAKEALKANQQN